MGSEFSGDKVIFRIPDSNTIYFIENGTGDDAFILQAFDKTQEKKEIRGNLRSIDSVELNQILNRIQLCEASDKRSIDYDSYKNMIDAAQKEIREEKFKKVVLAGQFWKDWEPDIAKLYTRLLKNYPKAFVYVGTIGGEVYIGASPEPLLVKRDTVLLTEALGGTKTNGSYTKKEEIEHSQIVDYIQEILNTNSYDYKFGNTESKPAGFIEHLCTKFTIHGRSVNEDIELANALHPTSAVCGLPFSESINFINKHENLDRQYYSGFLGPCLKDGDFSLYVNLRCAKIFKSGLMFFAGAGINSLSNPKDEWDEINNKVNTIAQFLK
jgi:isochorismate synthase